MDKKSGDAVRPEKMEKGVQPLDRIMTGLGLHNADLVGCSKEQLTFKVVAKGRRGRRLTLNSQTKILKALNGAQTVKQFALRDLFNYESQK